MLTVDILGATPEPISIQIAYAQAHHGHKLPNIEAQGISNLEDDIQGRLTLPTLNPAKVGTLNVGHVRKGLLSNTCSKSGLTHNFAKRLG